MGQFIMLPRRCRHQAVSGVQMQLAEIRLLKRIRSNVRGARLLGDAAFGGSAASVAGLRWQPAMASTARHPDKAAHNALRLMIVPPGLFNWNDSPMRHQQCATNITYFPWYARFADVCSGSIADKLKGPGGSRRGLARVAGIEYLLLLPRRKR